jgi:diguanylate cyclase (GGDEF)-like protein/PAS domain S-box-containing protein
MPGLSNRESWGFGRLFATIKDAVIVADATTGDILLWNRGAENIFQYSTSEVTSLTLTSLVPERLRDAHLGGMKRYSVTGRGEIIDSASSVELPAVRKDGLEILIQLTLSAIPNPPDVEGVYVMAIIREVTKMREAEEAMQLALQAAPVPTLLIGLDNRCSWLNGAAAALLGYEPDELIGQDLHDAIHHSHPDGTPFPAEECSRSRALKNHESLRVGDEVYWRKDGTSFPVDYQVEPLVRDGVFLGAVVTFTDITERVRQQAEAQERESILRESANTDALTGVGNRRLADLLLRSLAPNDVVIMIDLDHFKSVNDRFGHPIGDEVLVSLAKHLRLQLRDVDGVARYGGEEFLVILRNAGEGGMRFATRITEEWAASSPVTTFSAGVAIHKEGQSESLTLHRADEALYEAKRKGRNCVVQAEG